MTTDTIERSTPPTARETPDAAVIAASREALRLVKEGNATDDDDAGYELQSQAEEARNLAMRTPVETLAGAAAVVRCLIIESVGIRTMLSDAEEQMCIKALAHVLAVVEREAAKGGAS